MAANTTTKPSKPRPNRRQQQSLVFVEPYTNPAAERKSAKNKHIVKKWSMLNRKNFHRPNATIEINERPVPAPSTTLQPLSPDGSEDDDGIEDTLSTLLTAALVTNTVPIHLEISSPLFNRNDDPFGTLPFHTERRVFELLYNYLSYHHVEDRPWFQPDDDYGSLLVAARKQTWFPVAKESKAAYICLLALITASSPFQSQFAGVRDRLLVEAYRLTNEELASSRALANSTVLAVVLLALIAQMMQDDDAYLSHNLGLKSILESRKRHPEKAWAFMRPERYPFEPLLSKHTARFSGEGFRKLAERGFISAIAWATDFRDAMRIGNLIVMTPGDTFWWSAMTQHKWLMGAPMALGFTALDKVFHATYRLNCHLIVWHGALLTSPIVRGMIVEIRSQLAKSDTEALLSVQPSAVLWIALSAGPYALNLQGWFHKLLHVAIIASGYPTLEKVVQLMEDEYLWHHNKNAMAEKFWRQSDTEATMEACCRPDIARRPSEEDTEADLAKAFQALEFGESYLVGLETQNKKCRQCLCAWWV